MLPIAPCKGCEQREAGCHSRCPAYICFVKKNEKFKKERFRQSDEDSFFSRPRNLYSCGRSAQYSRGRDFG